ncbi:acyltransferase [Seonamhaeicola sp. NFXS20]|uniref:acyltransferase family protein n=1 Tax=Seonamhaeicola sp. NFXS20 TaxID=2816959 RepID=UPI003B8E83F9
MDKINTNNFDFLRVVFASTVAISHLIELSGIEIFQPYSVFFNTRLAIDGFFVISGFLIAKSFQNSASLKDYIIKRIKRIVPAYMLVIFICALFLCFISSLSFENYFLNVQFWEYLGANLTFQNYLQPCLPGVFENNKICAVNGALWTIKIEEAFYLLIPVFYWLVNSKKFNIYALCLLTYIVSISYFNYFLAIDMYRIAKQLPGALALFTTGMVLFHNFSFFLKWKHYIILPCLILFILEQYILNTHILKPATFGFMVFYIAYNFKAINEFGKYGDFTYGIYIFHFPIIQTFVHLDFYNKYNPYICSLLTLLLTLVFAVLSWYFIELPNLSKARRIRQKSLLTKTN